MRRYLLLYRFLIVNIVGAALLGLAGAQGWLARLVEADPTGLVFVIFGVFAVGLALCGYRLFKTSAALNKLEEGETADLPAAWTRTPIRPEFKAEALKARLFSRIAVVRQIASALVVLGLIGTVTGFIIALSGVSAEDAGTLAAVQPMISTLISGMSVALYTTLEGAVLGCGSPSTTVCWRPAPPPSTASSSRPMDEFDDDSGTIFRDVTLLALAAFVAMVLMLLPFLNPGCRSRERGRRDQRSRQCDHRACVGGRSRRRYRSLGQGAGQVAGRLPQQGQRGVNLLRDDLGLFQDLTDINYEIVYSRGIVPGEWIVNVQAYRLEDPIQPVPVQVQVVVSVKREGENRPTPILEKEVELRYPRHETTVFRFALTGKGALVHGSVNDVRLSLIREYAQSQLRSREVRPGG